jgi:hypothetical protein
MKTKDYVGKCNLTNRVRLRHSSEILSRLGQCLSQYFKDVVLFSLLIYADMFKQFHPILNYPSPKTNFKVAGVSNDK